MDAHSVQDGMEVMEKYYQKQDRLTGLAIESSLKIGKERCALHLKGLS